MSTPSLSHAATAVLQTVAQGYQHGFDIIRVTGLPSGTVYPALRRLEEARQLISAWEEARVAQDAGRPARKYYDITPAGRVALAGAIARYRLLAPPPRARRLRPSRA
jgi:PadR family transcriptional regulator, regulatory protein PadR